MRRRTRKKLLIVLVAFILVVSAGIIYLNSAILPVKIKTLIVNAIEDATQKKTSLQSLSFSIFKGLVLKNLVISDDAKTILSLKECSASVLLLPFFKKQIIIPSMRIESGVLFVQRRRDKNGDGSIFYPFIPLKKIEPSPFSKSPFNIIINKISIRNACIDFQDNTLDPVFAEQAYNLDADLFLALPAKVKFNFSCAINAGKNYLPVQIKSSGEYNIFEQELSAQLEAKDLSPQEFLVYYKNSGFSLPNGIVNGLAKISFKNNVLGVDMDFESKELVFLKDKISAQLDASVKIKSSYRLTDQHFFCSADADISRFTSSVTDAIEKIEGRGKLSFNTYPQVSLAIDILGGTLKLSKFNHSFEAINGRLGFNSGRLIWTNLRFTCLDADYTTSGTLDNFSAPQVQLKLSAPGLNLESIFKIKDNQLTLSKAEGGYFNSDFALDAIMDIAPSVGENADINLKLVVNLSDFDKWPLGEFKTKIEKIKPSGTLRIGGNISGNINDIQSCLVKAKASAGFSSFYGLKFQDLSLNCNQENKVFDLVSSASFYGGTLAVDGKINLDAKSLPFLVNIDARGIMIQRLKMDTPEKYNDISGVIKSHVKLNGFSNKLDSLSGSGEVFISEGKFWQLDLFKGIGKLIFARDFTNIIFTEGSCGFVVADKIISTDNLKLKSNLAELEGSAKIGFDNSIDASLKVHVLDEAAPLTNALKDIATAIVGSADSLGTIKITGTLKEPKYKFHAAVVDVIKELKDTFLDSIFKK